MTGSRPFGAGPARSFLQLATAAVLCLSAGAAWAEAVALVEDIGEPRPGVQFMDYLNAGQMIALHPGEQLVIDYLRSCTRETIVGGVVSVGTEKSVVIGGTVKSETVECDGGKLDLTAGQASKTGVMVFRGGNLVKGAAVEGASAPPPRMLYGTDPLIDLKGGGRVIIERLDRPGEKHVIDLEKGKRILLDCGKQGCSLQPGGTYRASAGGREVTFKVSDKARPGVSPVSRLLRL